LLKIDKEIWLKISTIFVIQNDMEPSKAVPLNASKQDGPMPKPHSVSLNDTETRKLREECKRLQGEMMKLSEENRHLRVSSVG
jgi:hypothetical protein